MSSKVLVAPANTARPARHALRLLTQLAIGAHFALIAVAALAGSGPACQKGGSAACQIIYTGGAVDHGDTGNDGQAIVSTFTDQRTLTAIDGPSGWAAIQLESSAGDGGAADHDGQDGGHGGQGATVSATIGQNVSAQGVTSVASCASPPPVAGAAADRATMWAALARAARAAAPARWT